eukprot:1861208-Rhodomonas_salina.1
MARQHVVMVSIQPVRCLLAEVNQLDEQRGSVVFKWHALDLAEQHLRMVVTHHAVGGRVRVAEVDDEEAS